MSKKIQSTRLLDCDIGRRLGCRSFCCRLLVRLKEHERTEYDPSTKRLKGFVDKYPNGKCVHQDEQTGLCKNWKNRPSICREYDCNNDIMLQVVMRSSGDSLAGWIKESVQLSIPEHEYKLIPYIRKGYVR